MMQPDTRLMREISDLTIHLMYGTISEQGVRELEELLESNPLAVEYYLEILITHVGINSMEGISSLQEFDFDISPLDQDKQFDLTEVASGGSQGGLDSNVSLRGVDLDDIMSDVNQSNADDSDKTRDLLEILELERTSPTVVIENQQTQDPPPELIQEVVYPPLEKRKLTKFQKFQLAFAACIIGFMIYISYAPVPVPPPVVAELADSIDSVWDDDLELPDEYGYMVQSRYRLKKGYASILFNGGASVTVEAPAELSLNSTGDMKLYSGKIYAVVPEKAQGFTVMAGDNKIVDLGTEFGVEVDTSNNTQLHVTKGKTLLYSGPKDGPKTKNNVDAGQAKKIYNDGFVKDIDVVEEKFARHIDSKTGIVLKDEFMPGKKTFVAYNDLGATTGHESTGNITTHLVGNDELAWGMDDSGKELINYLDGSPTGVSISIDHANGLDSREEGFIRPPALGTPAYSLFNVPGLNLKNGMVRVGNKTADYPGNYTDMTLTLKGLNPEMLYDLALYGDRDRPLTFNTGVERFTLGSAESARNISSTGIIDNLTTEMETLQNADAGHVIRWTSIDPGADGKITVKVDAGFYGKVANIAYLSAMRLEAVSAGSNR